MSRLDGRLIPWPELRDLLSRAAQQPDQPYLDTITVTDTPHLVLPRTPQTARQRQL